MSRLLTILDSAYRANAEEQDDPAVWLARVLRTGGADVDLLLRNSAVNYAVRAQDAGGLAFGSWRQQHPADLQRDLGELQSQGARVYALAEDLEQRGIQRDELLDKVEVVRRSALPELVARYQRLWRF